MSYCYNYPRPCVTVDAVVFRKVDDQWEVLLILRKNYPFEGNWALPGGFIEMHETLEEAVARELEEETGLKGVRLEQVKAFSEVDRDPRQRTIAVAFAGIVEEKDSAVQSGDDAAAARWFPVSEMPELAFDHHQIFLTALRIIN